MNDVLMAFVLVMGAFGWACDDTDSKSRERSRSAGSGDDEGSSRGANGSDAGSENEDGFYTLVDEKDFDEDDLSELTEELAEGSINFLAVSTKPSKLGTCIDDQGDKNEKVQFKDGFVNFTSKVDLADCKKYYFENNENVELESLVGEVEYVSSYKIDKRLDESKLKDIGLDEFSELLVEEEVEVIQSIKTLKLEEELEYTAEEGDEKNSYTVKSTFLYWFGANNFESPCKLTPKGKKDKWKYDGCMLTTLSKQTYDPKSKKSPEKVLTKYVGKDVTSEGEKLTGTFEVEINGEEGEVELKDGQVKKKTLPKSVSSGETKRETSDKDEDEEDNEDKDSDLSPKKKKSSSD